MVSAPHHVHHLSLELASAKPRHDAAEYCGAPAGVGSQLWPRFVPQGISHLVAAPSGGGPVASASPPDGPRSADSRIPECPEAAVATEQDVTTSCSTPFE